MTEVQVPIYWSKVFTTLCEMMTDRGYILDGEPEELFEEKYYFTNPITEEKILVICNINKKVGKQDIRNIFIILESDDISHCIIIVDGQLTPDANKAINMSQQRIEVFTTDNLVFNVTKHILVPEHIPLNEQEKKDLLTRYHIKENQIPRMLSSDPVAMYYGLLQGTVVKIIREEVVEDGNDEEDNYIKKYVTYRYIKA
jgi:DNA-directed RNA polymerase subunit H (RpoH/RPB5)